MKKVYIAHPLRGENRAKNVEEVTRICQLNADGTVKSKPIPNEQNADGTIKNAVILALTEPQGAEA